MICARRYAWHGVGCDPRETFCSSLLHSGLSPWIGYHLWFAFSFKLNNHWSIGCDRADLELSHIICRSLLQLEKTRPNYVTSICHYLKRSVVARGNSSSCQVVDGTLYPSVVDIVVHVLICTTRCLLSALLPWFRISETVSYRLFNKEQWRFI